MPSKLTVLILAFSPSLMKNVEPLPVFVERLHDGNDLGAEVAVFLIGQADLFRAFLGLLLVQKRLALDRDFFLELVVA